MALQNIFDFRRQIVKSHADSVSGIAISDHAVKRQILIAKVHSQQKRRTFEQAGICRHIQPTDSDVSGRRLSARVAAVELDFDVDGATVKLSAVVG